MDIGCGFGYLAYFLHYRDESRLITGIDYDDDKIKLAQHGYDKTDNLQFIHGDIRNLNLIDVKYNKNMGLLINKNFDKLNSFVFSNLKKESQIIHNNVQTRVDYMQSFNPRHVKTKENKHLELGDFELLENEKFVKNINEF